MDRVILHCDCNSFFASVETALNPAYRDVPMAVCGSAENRHGIVLAKNELAKKYGIVTAETVYSAKRKCPSLVIASPHYDEYTRYSRAVNAIYREYTDLVEPFGIDESWLDVTASGRIFGTGEEIAEMIRSRVKSEIGITVSIGVSFNKVFAKLGSDYKKPDAITVISRENFKDLIYSLPASDMLFVGKRTAEELLHIGVRTIGELASLDREILTGRFGKMGELLYTYSRGLDDSPVLGERDREDVKSISNGYTFKHDLTTREECRIGIDFLCEELGSKLRAKRKRCSTVTLTVKDEYLNSIQRQRRIEPTDIAKEIADRAYSILLAEWREGKPIRMLTVGVSGLVDSDSVVTQMDIFGTADDEKRTRDRKREETVDKLRQKYGNSVIRRGATIGTDLGIYDDKKD